jgi:FlaA1/EpsC-like NDP-sugar epimerase
MANLILSLRNRHVFLLDFLALLFIPALALTLRLDRMDWWPETGRALILYTTVALCVNLAIFHRLDLYNRYWRYAGVNDLADVLFAVGLSTAILTVVFASAHSLLETYHLAMYRTVPLIGGLLTLVFVAGVRSGMRGVYYWSRRRGTVVGGRRVLIVGAGESGTMVAREMRANPELDMEPVAFVDDDPAKAGIQIQGTPVLGTIEQIPDLVERHHIQRIIVAIPSAPLGRLRAVTAVCEQTGVETFSLPGMYQLLAGHKTVSRLPEIDINHLLHREPVELDQSGVANIVADASVLVTGAGGSIGSELCRQIARFNPAELILLGHGENSIYEINLDLRLSYPDLVTKPVIADVRDPERITAVVREHKPDIIFHTAAHKHVPLMEASAGEAFTNNVLGTQNVLWAAEEFGVERFVLISTDKAVNPTSMMGSTKRLAELLVVAAAQRTGRAYMAVRFGNVLGSRGSVIPVFQRQIAAGGPLTITHPEMSRYFMTIPEAVQLVLQASELGEGGETFVLDMGEPVRILDLAQDLLKLSGLKPGRDIEIVYTGVRPGEKLSEELFLAREHSQSTQYPRIFKAVSDNTIESVMLEKVVLELINLTCRLEAEGAVDEMRVLLPQVCNFIDNYQLPPTPSLPAPPSKRKRFSTGPLFSQPSLSRS